MSTPDKPDPARGWEALEALSAGDDAKWLETATDEEVERRMNEAGVTAAATPGADELLARMKERAPGPVAKRPDEPRETAATVVRLRASRRNVALWGGALALAAGIALVVGRALNVPDEVSAGHTEIEHARFLRAAALRDDAYAACEAHEWATCEAKLDEARALDPESEVEPPVTAARAALADAGLAPRVRDSAH